MALKTRLRAAHLISAHIVPDGLPVSLPSTLPGRYVIPSIEDDARAVKKRCSLSLSDAFTKQTIQWQYAEIKKDKEGPYVLLSIPDSKTIRLGTEIQKYDEFGHVLLPDVSRTPLPVLAEDIANEIERQNKSYGVITIAAEEPVAEELTRARNLSRSWQVKFINEVSQYVSQVGQIEATPLAVYVANYLYANGSIPELPEWAARQVDETQSPNLRTCPNCLSVLSVRSANCLKCSAIIDWKLAVDRGLVAPSDVPPSRRVEAGLAAAQ